MLDYFTFRHLSHYLTEIIHTPDRNAAHCSQSTPFVLPAGGQSTTIVPTETHTFRYFSFSRTTIRTVPNDTENSSASES